MSHFSDQFVYFTMHDTKPGLETGKEKGGFPPTPPAPSSTAAAQPAQAQARPAACTAAAGPARISLARRHVRRVSGSVSVVSPAARDMAIGALRWLQIR